MANTNTDLTDEDAADLQFPKAITSNEKMRQLNSVDSDCLNCHSDLSLPYIVCVVCNVNICCICFANGAEFSDHRNDHDYSIFDNSNVLFTNSNWTANEELTLINTLIDYGNFDVVARCLPNRGVKEVRDHYEYYYLEKGGSDTFLSFEKVHTITAVENKIMPYRFRLNDVDEPPRYTASSSIFHAMAGYNAPRSDFELEYDSNAEDLIANLNFHPTHNELITNLQCAIIRSYNRRLAERQRRKTIIRNHGLILIRKTIAWLRRYDMTISKKVYERMCRFVQFYTGSQFEFVMEGLHRAGELKLEISRLQEFHSHGITTIPAARLYLHLKQAREDSSVNVKAFKSNTQFNWKIKNSLLSTLLPQNVKKRGSYSPLDIVGLPGYEKLSVKEQDLCKNARLVPLSYIEFRDILVGESRKVGYLKLQTARRLLKIDVNKTRRLYDFLVTEGYINKE